MRTKSELRRLIQGAMGEVKADLIVTGGKLINVYSGEILDGMEIAVLDGRICYVGPSAARAWRGDENLGCGRALYLSWFYRRTHAHRSLLPALRISSGISPARDDGAHGVLRRIGDGFWLSWCEVFSRRSCGASAAGVHLDFNGCATGSAALPNGDDHKRRNQSGAPRPAHSWVRRDRFVATLNPAR